MLENLTWFLVHEIIWGSIRCCTSKSAGEKISGWNGYETCRYCLAWKLSLSYILSVFSLTLHVSMPLGLGSCTIAWKAIWYWAILRVLIMIADVPTCMISSPLLITPGIRLRYWWRRKSLINSLHECASEFSHRSDSSYSVKWTISPLT